ncbi:MAG: hypothetical protein WBD27_01965 [Pyrinomonadaceae bacterium]
MIELNGKKIIISLLEERLQSSTSVRSNFRTTGLDFIQSNRALALETFKRWKERAYAIIYSYFNNLEANKFWNVPTNMIYQYPINLAAGHAAVAQINSHVAWINSLIATIKENHIRVNRRHVEREIYRILILIYNTRSSKVPIDLQELSDSLIISPFELDLYVKPLVEKDFVELASDDKVELTEAGTKESLAYVKSYREKKAMEQSNESFAAKQYRVLRLIYELRHASPDGWVPIASITQRANLPWNELNDILINLENRKCLIDATEDLVKLNGAGIEQMEASDKNPNEGTKDFPATIINNYHSNTTFNAPVGGFQQHTANSTQNVTQQIAINPDFSQAIESLADIIRTSHLVDLEKEEKLLEVERIRQLSDRDQTPEVKALAKTKILTLENGLKAADLAVKAGTAIATLLKAFN